MEEQGKNPTQGQSVEQTPNAEGVSGNSATSKPKAERLTRPQVLFFLLVVVFAVFLIFLKFILEKKMNANRTYAPVDYSNEQPGYPDDIPGYDPNAYDPGAYDPSDYGNYPDDPDEPIGPVPDEGN